MPLLYENSHRADLIRSFGTLRPHVDFDPPKLSYLFLLFTNRCGSNFLAQALAATGSFNEAQEVFNADTILSHAQARNLSSLQHYFSALPQMVPHNEWLTAKLAVSQIEILHEAGILGAIQGHSRFILMERQDRLAQAISRCIAWQTQRWTSEQPSQVPDEALTYSRACIEEQVAQITLENGLLYRFLANTGRPPFHLSYEALVAEPQAHLDAIASWLDIPKRAMDPARIRIVRQSNHINDAWRRRYLAGG